MQGTRNGSDVAGAHRKHSPLGAHQLGIFHPYIHAARQFLAKKFRAATCERRPAWVRAYTPHAAGTQIQTSNQRLVDKLQLRVDSQLTTDS